MVKKNLLFVALLLAAACQKNLKFEEVTVPERTCRISKMIQGINNGSLTDTIYTFHYNDAGRLERVNEHYLETNAIYDYFLQYDANDRLVHVGPDIETDFTYDGRGLLKEVKYGFGDDSARIEYDYSSGDLPTGARITDKINGQWTNFGEAKYTFSNGNMVKKDWLENGVVKWSETYDYYDNIDNLKTHCLLGMHSVPLGYWEEFLYFNKNMLRKTNDPDYGYSLDIKTDSGRMVNSITTWLHMGDPVIRETKNYSYDCK